MVYFVRLICVGVGIMVLKVKVFYVPVGRGVKWKNRWRYEFRKT